VQQDRQNLKLMKRTFIGSVMGFNSATAWWW
jgi:hypothetical protein